MQITENPVALGNSYLRTYLSWDRFLRNESNDYLRYVLAAKCTAFYFLEQTAGH